MSATMTQVLIVESNDIVARDLTYELKQRGIRFIQRADCLSDAMEAMSNGLPDIAVIELNLRDGAGGQLAKALAMSGVQVCVYSSQQELADSLMGISHTFITKPAPAYIVAAVVHDQASAAFQRSAPAQRASTPGALPLSA